MYHILTSWLCASVVLWGHAACNCRRQAFWNGSAARRGVSVLSMKREVATRVCATRSHKSVKTRATYQHVSAECHSKNVIRSYQHVAPRLSCQSSHKTVMPRMSSESLLHEYYTNTATQRVSHKSVSSQFLEVMPRTSLQSEQTCGITCAFGLCNVLHLIFLDACVARPILVGINGGNFLPASTTGTEIVRSCLTVRIPKPPRDTCHILREKGTCT